MNITNTWGVVQMDAYPQGAGETNVVFNVHWTFKATGGAYVSSTYGAQRVTVDPDAPFTPYADLTEAQVIGWVHGAMGAENVKNCEITAANQIIAQLDPPVVTPPLPWVELELPEDAISAMPN